MVPAGGRDEVAYVEEVAVAAEHQGRGIGGALLLRCLEWAGELGFEAVELYLSSSPSWVTKVGFVATSHRNYRRAAVR